ncbi:DUF6790 family protein [Streptomyces sp. NPDC127039]|uniref:DUF6790 family protein n=1 Tax=Streptomyces sp. NPDC127039 TaxID=3347115 RepID=UPI0036596A17
MDHPAGRHRRGPSAFGFGRLYTVAFLGAPDVMATALGFDRTPFGFAISFAGLGPAVMIVLAVLSRRPKSATPWQATQAAAVRHPRSCCAPWRLTAATPPTARTRRP